MIERAYYAYQCNKWLFLLARILFDLPASIIFSTAFLFVIYR
jgi:hypothetical protein